jgi:hypothetical protein
VADVFGFVHASADAVPTKKINPRQVPVPSLSTTNAAEYPGANNTYQWWGNNEYGGFFPDPFPHVAGITSIDVSAGAPDHMAFVGFHQWQCMWPVTGYSSDGGQTWISFGSVPTQDQPYTDGSGQAQTNTFKASGGAIAIGAAVPAGRSKPALVWVPATGTYGNPWWNLSYWYMSPFVPWHSVSADGGQTWQSCRLANAAQVPSIVMAANGGYPSVPGHQGDLPKGWGNQISPWACSRIVAADPSDATGQTFYYYCNNGPYTGTGSESWGVFYKSVDGGVTWTKGAEGRFPAWNVRPDIKVNPARQGDVWMTFPRNAGQITPNRLYRSQDGGTTFATVASVDGAEYVAFGKGQGGSATPALYLFGRVGGAAKNAFYRSDDLGQTWTRISDYGYLTVVDLAADPRTYGVVYAAMNGRGLLAGRAPSGSLRLAPAVPLAGQTPAVR